MALDDFTTESSSSTSISTRKKLKNVDLPERWWDIMVTTDPGYAYTAAGLVDDEASIKAIVQKMDEAIEDDIDGHRVGDSTKEELKQLRSDILEDHL